MDIHVDMRSPCGPAYPKETDSVSFARALPNPSIPLVELLKAFLKESGNGDSISGDDAHAGDRRITSAGKERLKGLSMTEGS